MTAAWMRLWHARVSYVLQHAGVEHVFLKGSSWSVALTLPHVSADVDVLIAPEQFRRAVNALLAAGFAPAMVAVAEDEMSLHSTPLRAPDGGPEVDVHRSFPGLDADPSLTWKVLGEGVRSVALGHHPVPVLSDDSQVLIAAAAAARDGSGSSASRRLSGAVGLVEWPAVVVQARRMRADGTLRAGLVAAGLPELADQLELGPVPYRFAGHRSSGERRLEEVLTYPWRRRGAVAVREVWPSAGFLALTQPGVRVPVARLRHLGQVLGQLPGAVGRVAGRRVRGR